MSSFWKSNLDSCPVCKAPIEVEEGPVSNTLVCRECGAELIIRPKHLKRLVDACVVAGFFIALIQKLTVPVFLVAFPAYSFLLLLGLRQFVMPHLPHELRPSREYVQSLRLGGYDHKER